MLRRWKAKALRGFKKLGNHGDDLEAKIQRNLAQRKGQENRFFFSIEWQTPTKGKVLLKN